MSARVAQQPRLYTQEQSLHTDAHTPSPDVAAALCVAAMYVTRKRPCNFRERKPKYFGLSFVGSKF